MNEVVNIKINLKEFPDQKLRNRIKLSYNWLDENLGNLFDGGCSYGYGTRFLAQKSKNTYAMDINDLHISVAKEKYKKIEFKVGVLEDTKYDNEFFDTIVINDVLEHTNDKLKILSEMYRILKPGGSIIISTPHKGLFAFLDPYNYGYELKKYLPWLHKFLYKIIRFIKEGKFPENSNPEHEQKHEHYSLNDFKWMLAQSDLADRYIIEKVFRSGLLLEVLVMNIESIFNIFLPNRISRKLLVPFNCLAELDYWIPFGTLSYNIAIKIRKTSR